MVPCPTLSLVAGVRLAKDHLHQFLPAEFLRQFPGLRLGQPHQRRVDLERDLGSESDRLLEHAQCRVTAIGIA